MSKQFRWIIRPKQIYSTPRQFKELLGAKRTRPWPNAPLYKPSYTKDFFFTYPNAIYLEEWGNQKNRDLIEKYEHVYNFAKKNKYWQRMKMLEDGLPIIMCSKTPNDPCFNESKHGFIVRPDRHWGGEHYRITDNSSDFKPENEYISEVFLKHAEYRFLFFLGKFTSLLKKVVPDTLKANPKEAWNHAKGSTFTSIEWEGSNICSSHPEFISKLESIPYIQHSSICGIDILWRKPYIKILEINYAPGITIPSTIEKVKEHMSNVN